MMRVLSIILTVLFLFAPASYAQEKDQGKEQKKEAKPDGPPPALVVLSPVEEGEVQPMSRYVGTVFYHRTAKVASEVSGRVDEVMVEEGRRVNAGDVLAVLSTDLLDTRITSTEANRGRVQSELNRAERDFRRIQNLYREESVAESVYDEYKFKREGLQKESEALDAELERLRLEKGKAEIRAPFDGIILEKSVEEGEWVNPGGTVAVVSGDADVEAVIDVPQDILGYLKRGQRVSLTAGGKKYRGKFFSYVPSGDIATRTFSIKIRLGNPAGRLIEGMAISAILPTGPKVKGLLVPRDAVINVFGTDVVFVSSEMKAKMIPVKVTGYEGLKAGIEGSGLKAGMEVVIKGNERIREGQPMRLK